MGEGEEQLAPSKILTEAVQPVSILHNIKVFRQIAEAFGWSVYLSALNLAMNKKILLNSSNLNMTLNSFIL